jgi:hypothetical protein
MAARAGMADLITQVRQLASCGSADYSASGSTFWTDDQLQAHLDRVRTEVWEESLTVVPLVNSGGTTTYTDYRMPYQWLEQTTGGTAVFIIQEPDGTRIGTASYSVDYTNGRVTFGADQAGSVRYVTARSYDVYEAAARVWESKAAHVADRFDFTADGASFRASQLVTQYNNMARMMRNQSTTGGLRVTKMERTDIAPDVMPW